MNQDSFWVKKNKDTLKVELHGYLNSKKEVMPFSLNLLFHIKKKEYYSSESWRSVAPEGFCLLLDVPLLEWGE